jgi:hypothetical protein
MTITTAYDLDEPLFFLDNNSKIRRQLVYRIDTEISKVSGVIKYWFQLAKEGSPSDLIILTEDKVFRTKTELIQSLEP